MLEKIKISCRLRLEQRMFEPMSKNNYFDVLIELAEFLSCNLKVRKQVNTSNEYYTLTASSYKSLKIIIIYFKYLDYKN
jgi:hypothetical protein